MMTFAKTGKTFAEDPLSFCEETFHWGLQSWKTVIHKTKNISFSVQMVGSCRAHRHARARMCVYVCI